MKRLLLIFLFLLTALMAAWVVLRPWQPRDDASTAPLFPQLRAADVARIELTRLLDGAQLRRTEQGWNVAELVTPLREKISQQEQRVMPPQQWKRADAERVESAIAVVRNLPRGVLASTTVRHHPAFQVTEATALRVRLFGAQNDVLADLFIGKNGPDLASTYVRVMGDDRVWLVDRVLTGVFSADASDWAESAAPTAAAEPTPASTEKQERLPQR